MPPRLFRMAGVDMDGDDFEIGPAEFCLQRVERRHFAAARHAPGGPKIEKDAAAAPFGERQVAVLLEGVVLVGGSCEGVRAVRHHAGIGGDVLAKAEQAAGPQHPRRFRKARTSSK